MGSEQAFLMGLGATGDSERYLLLDHDAEIDQRSLATLLDTAALYPHAVLSANQCGTQAGWWPLELETRQSGSDLVALRAAQWSGLLLTPPARIVLLEQDSGYFFGWDDYLAVHRLRERGILVLGVPDATVENRRAWDAHLVPWRTYYQTRNELLFLRDTLASRTEVCRATGRRLRVLLGAARSGQVKPALTMGRGLVDGLVGRRGRSMTPQ